MFWSPISEKQVLKSWKFLIFMQICPKIGIFSLKRAKRPPGGHWDPPGGQKFLFRVTRIWKLNERKKNFWFISHRRKVGLTIPSAWRPFWILGRATLVAKIFFWGHVLNQRGQCPGPFKTKKWLQWGGAPGVFWGASLFELALLSSPLQSYARREGGWEGG